MALGDVIGDTADALRRYLSDLYTGLRRVAGDIGTAAGRIYSTTPGKVLAIGGAAGLGAGLLGAGLGAGIHGFEVGEYGGNPLNPFQFYSYVPYSPYAPPPEREPPQKFIETTSLGAIFNPLVIAIIAILIIIIIFLIATRK
ncbi:hypothetical protein STIV2_C141 [Sulfolobus turreted icosahedral virus 2]|uniref:Uncharacterized protein n=1 Tax=Sulfolobus turreted icosahedral virus 2 TaxID=754004 RepID=D5IEX0_9VIRU|nr:hypothetical protein STIV2_C141 [Sulfolobus turreted icosahedral virus 2]ADF27746.1 hypothetical protein STIV2_C141 [Sulfolobus turreted icosahedral virus 2]